MSRRHNREVQASVTSPITAPARIAPRISAVADKQPRPTEDEIRLLAYHKWVAAGQPQGDGVQFWMEAERELLT